ncbi:aspartyl protease family protein [Mucilaginibacter sp. HMF5004]|uniref:aspartyl protease family protein n=1 Tax=Mucilaginibacter rivuli TaxID=2857527 RepID=UPI001C5E7BE8|nr:aspartyl protease family protein [Mucilaginibacter rivuli]MBW4890455.1 aspartyl protease family protein [Mucilaginibacter rivuli]
MKQVFKRLSIVRILFSIYLLLYALPVLSQSFTINNNRKRVNIPFKLIRSMMVVQLTINNKGPFNFVLDTGVGLVIITDPTLIDSLGFIHKRLIKIAGLGNGDDYEAYVTPSLNIKFPDITGEGISAAILKKEQFNLSSYAGMPIHGLIGYEFFNSFAVKINFSDSTLTVGELKNIRVFNKSNKLPITIEDHKPYLNTNVKFTDGQQSKCKVVIDLGAGHALLLENQSGQNYLHTQKVISANLGVGLTGPITGVLSRINEIQLGNYKLKDIITSFPDEDSTKQAVTVKRDGNLGLNILKKFNMIIDYESNSMYLKANSHFNDPFEHDMSGMEYYADGPDLKHIIINRVEHDSPADEVGLECGDEIVSINFKPTHTMTVEEIDAIFQSRTDRTLLLEIARHDKRDHVILKLKRRI